MELEEGQFQDMLSLLSFHESSIDRRFWVDSTDGDFLVASFFYGNFRRLVTFIKCGSDLDSRTLGGKFKEYHLIWFRYIYRRPKLPL